MVLPIFRIRNVKTKYCLRMGFNQPKNQEEAQKLLSEERILHEVTRIEESDVNKIISIISRCDIGLNRLSELL